jgi:peptidoglycan/xylan/chitin deacetylase (PgdA/CDA1 family)
VLDWAGFRAAVSFTFDDSQPSHIAHYAELQAAGVPMTFYINAAGSGPVEFDATWARAVRDGHEIGNHTYHHCRADLTGCLFGAKPATPASEIDGNAAYVTQHTAQPAVWTMASPFGDTGWDGPAQASVFLNRGVHGGTIAPRDGSDPFDLPAHVAGTGENADSLNRQTDQARIDGRWLIFVLHSIAPTTASWYNPVDIGAITGSMTHARALGDVWVGTVVAVGAYWRAQRLLASSTPFVAGDRTTWTWTLPPHFPAGHRVRVRVDGGTLRQRDGAPLPWNDHGYYEVALDAGELTLSP